MNWRRDSQAVVAEGRRKESRERRCLSFVFDSAQSHFINAL